jgi:hypothetical protein
MVKTGNCDPASRGETQNEFEIDVPIQGQPGAYMAVECHFTWDGVSVWPFCDGPVIYLRTSNTSVVTVWALLPDKKRGDPWVAIPPGTTTITRKQDLSTLGLSNATDVQRVTLTAISPA